MRDIETIDSEVRLVAALRRAAWERGGPLPSIDVADALLDETPREVSAPAAQEPVEILYADRTSPPDQLPGLSLSGIT